MSLKQLIAEKNLYTEPRGPAWIKFVTSGGPELVPSSQTCFEGGIGARPRVSERCAGKIIPSIKKIFPCKNCKLDCYEKPEFCWQNPCNTIIRKYCPECCGAKNIYLTR